VKDKAVNMMDRIGFHFGQLILEQSELEQIREMEMRKMRINEFLTGDVKTNYTPTDYKKIMSKGSPSSLLTDIAY
jgi:hypothetical protein